jgi:putative addiction module CopG family antidote
MEVVLTKELEDFVKAKVAEGRYLDESEVVREAIRHLEDRERYESPELEALLLEGLDSGSRPWTQEVMAEIRQLAALQEA